jgi:hypothetical protein
MNSEQDQPNRQRISRPDLIEGFTSRLSAFGLRFVLAKLNPKGVQFLNREIRGIRGRTRLPMCSVSAYSAYFAVVPGRLWLWLLLVEILDFGFRTSDFGLC